MYHVLPSESGKHEPKLHLFPWLQRSRSYNALASPRALCQVLLMQIAILERISLALDHLSSESISLLGSPLPTYPRDRHFSHLPLVLTIWNLILLFSSRHSPSPSLNRKDALLNPLAPPSALFSCRGKSSLGGKTRQCHRNKHQCRGYRSEDV